MPLAMVIFTNLDNIWDKSSNRHTWKNVGSTVQPCSWFSVGFSLKVADGIFQFQIVTGKSGTSLGTAKFSQ
jgi:hypothetical protein